MQATSLSARSLLTGKPEDSRLLARSAAGREGTAAAADIVAEAEALVSEVGAAEVTEVETEVVTAEALVWELVMAVATELARATEVVTVAGAETASAVAPDTVPQEVEVVSCPEAAAMEVETAVVPALVVAMEAQEAVDTAAALALEAVQILDQAVDTVVA